MDTPSTPSSAVATAGADPATAFRQAQQRVLDRYGVAAESRLVDVAATRGRAQVLVAGDGPPLVMVIGGNIPGVFWTPLVAALPGHTCYVVELPGNGLTDPVPFDHHTVRATAVAHLGGVLDALGLDGCRFVTQSMGSLWTVWLASAHPQRVRSQVMIACPAFFPDTSAPLPMRLMSLPGLGRLMLARPPTAKGAEQIMRAVGEHPEDVPEIRDAMVASQRMPTNAAGTLTLMRAMMRWTRPRREIVMAPEELRTVAHPVRLIWGDEDPFGPPDAGRRTAALLPDADFHRVPGGHAPWFDDTVRVAALTQDFLDHHPYPAPPHPKEQS